MYMRVELVVIMPLIPIENVVNRDRMEKRNNEWILREVELRGKDNQGRTMRAWKMSV